MNNYIQRFGTVIEILSSHYYDTVKVKGHKEATKYRKTRRVIYHIHYLIHNIQSGCGEGRSRVVVSRCRP